MPKLTPERMTNSKDGIIKGLAKFLLSLFFFFTPTFYQRGLSCVNYFTTIDFMEEKSPAVSLK